MRALLTSRRSVLDANIRMAISLRGVLRNFGLKLGPVSKGRYRLPSRKIVRANAKFVAFPQYWGSTKACNPINLT